jgi:hypothetical protein
MQHIHLYLRYVLVLLVFPYVLVACSSAIQDRLDIAHDITHHSGFIETQIRTELFIITSFEKTGKGSASANLYIEGDGLAWIGKRTPSTDPTPTNPIALRLAAQDPAENVFYLARPCQYTKMANREPCDKKYWTSARFSTEVIASFHHALDDIKSKHHIKEFNLIGFSGGAAIAILAASGRSDVASIRTVAGNLDIAAFSQIHNITPLHKSLNPLNIAGRVSHIPQWHFIGSDDVIITPAIVENFIAASGNNNCLHTMIVPHTSHESGWFEIWSGLLKHRPVCN